MKYIFVGLVGVAAFSVGVGGAAIAADMPLKAPVYVPAVYNWTGCYLARIIQPIDPLVAQAGVLA